MSTVWHCFCDETCTAKPNRYLAVGGVLVKADMSDGYHAAIEEWRTTHNMRAELKWTKIKHQKYGEYSNFVSRSTRSVRRGFISFAALTVDRHLLDLKRYSDGDEDVGYNKLFYQIILHRLVGRTDPQDRLIVYPDKKNDEASYSELKSALNNGIRKKYGRQRCEVVDVQGICSKKHNLAQMNDLFLGAVGCHANRKHLAQGVSLAKSMLAHEIARGVGLVNLAEATPYRWRTFQVWPFQFRPRIEKGASTPNLSVPQVYLGP